MDIEEFRRNAHQVVDWIAQYMQTIRARPVRSPCRPGEIYERLPQHAPEQADSFAQVFQDFRQLIMPGITHWQHPRFFAYFPANSSFPSLLAEMLTAALGAQCMSWQTSPAATELEQRVMEWLRQLIGLPADFTGVIQGGASTATLVALLTARERAHAFAANTQGLARLPVMTVYCSQEAHSSVERAVRIAGLGSANLRKIAVDSTYAMVPEALEKAIAADISRGLHPLAVIVATGTTGSTAIDPLAAIVAIAKRYNLWVHVDAAYAGTALVLPNMRHIIAGIEGVDSFVFNPHKWLFTNFDCSAYFVKDVPALTRTFAILPEYLKTREGAQVVNYRDWGIPLGRRFRALKLWFVLRLFGAQGIRDRVARHMAWARETADDIRASKDFELLAPVPLATVCFRYHPAGTDDPAALDSLNTRLLEQVNDSGSLYITHTRLGGAYCLRFVVGQTYVTAEDVREAWADIATTARGLSH